MPAEATDLMQRYCDGDAAAFRGLHALVAPKLLGYLTHMARDRAVAEDLLQQTFLKVHRARGAYVRGADPVPWIYAIAHRTFLDDARSKKRAIVRPVEEVPDVAAPVPDEPVDAEQVQAALAALDQLPPQQREAVVLTKLDGRSIAEAAEIAGTSPGAMKVRAHRGYAALRKLLGGRVNLHEIPPVPPPLSDALEAELARLAPVAPRDPRKDFLKIASLSLAYGAVLVALLTIRRDLHGLPVWWLVTYGAAWLGGFIGLAYLAVVPRPGSVMPRWRLVAIGAVLISLGFVGTGLIMHPSGPESRQLTLATVHHGHGCLELGLITALVPALLGAIVLRGAVPVASRWIAAGLGAAGGSLGGLVLHLHCPIADRWHVGLVHGGVVGVAALVAALLVPRLTDSARSRLR